LKPFSLGKKPEKRKSKTIQKVYRKSIKQSFEVTHYTEITHVASQKMHTSEAAPQ
jgi:hypothetical protein